MSLERALTRMDSELKTIIDQMKVYKTELDKKKNDADDDGLDKVDDGTDTLMITKSGKVREKPRAFKGLGKFTVLRKDEKDLKQSQEDPEFTKIMDRLDDLF